MVSLPTFSDGTYINVTLGMLGLATINAINKVIWNNHTVSNMTKFVGISGAAIGAIFTIVYFAQGVFATTKEKQSTTKAEKAKWEEFEDQSASDAAGCFITCVASLIALATLRIA